MDGYAKTWPRILLRTEGAAIFASTIWAFSRTGLSWWYFAAGLLLPDLGMAGYLSDSKLGAAIYNSVHTETPPIVLLCAGMARKDTLLSGVAFIWLAHIGLIGKNGRLEK
ncbi:hypothetical protein LTR86_001637 [Recurvomyces mirabilis]|nr:hypothetical protein LTR86_001637 [Recurvomyces mirabilis]